MLRTASLALGVSLVMAGFCSRMVCAGPEAIPGAKGLFFEQLQKPQEQLNTGLRYWIELKRKGVSYRATSKAPFFAGDRIRFHVCPNIDGFAYILLKTASHGEQSVLFPESGESNRVEHGHDYELPNDGYLAFDKNPGTEKLTLLLSRNRIDAQAFLAKPPQAPTMIASASSGSKDLIPAQVLVVLAPTEMEHREGKNLIPAKVVTPDPVVHVVKPVRKKNQTKAQVEWQKQQQRHAYAAGDETAITTVVRKIPSGVLFVDVALDHK